MKIRESSRETGFAEIKSFLFGLCRIETFYTKKREIGNKNEGKQLSKNLKEK